MNVTFTSLYEIQTSSVPAEQRCADFYVAKEVIVENGFRQITSSQKENDHQGGNDTLITECFRQKDGLRTIVITCCNNGMTLDLNEQAPTGNPEQHREFARKLQVALNRSLKNYSIKRVPPIKRGGKMWRYTELGDGRIAEIDVEEVLFDEMSEYQQVTIAKTRSNRNMLLLNGVENISENDHSYTSSLCGLERGITYKDKTVLILGGGDGAALECLRKLSPRMITMIEIDEVVMRACRTHLRSCCGESLDQYEGDNYKIIVGDCLNYLKQYDFDGRKFDYIISDITDVPIEVDDTIPKHNNNSKVTESWISGAGWKFFTEVFNLSLKLVDDEGLIMTHVTATSNVKGLGRFKTSLKSLNEQVDFEMFDSHVPSFSERWMFCHMKKHQNVDEAT